MSKNYVIVDRIVWDTVTKNALLMRTLCGKLPLSIAAEIPLLCAGKEDLVNESGLLGFATVDYSLPQHMVDACRNVLDVDIAPHFVYVYSWRDLGIDYEGLVPLTHTGLVLTPVINKVLCYGILTAEELKQKVKEASK